ncbi:DUF5107 domain-containing protein [Kitasatospora sp. NPDC058201]|uniref:DUF5107 domain-containing protein n=1 Tax=unclassified Kitasatospora TaxID=2633591 RepID=UPI00364F83BB
MTSTLRTATMRLPAAADPTPGILPILRGTRRRKADVSGADPEMRAQVAYGQPDSLLPYTTQDGYDRERAERELDVIVLENEILTATFLPSLGGRLWSLVHRPSGRELLYRNPILQPANLALRDAWTAGGVEWNLGATGHWPLTCSPLHAVRLSRPDGTPVLRMFEFERMRRLVFWLDFWLPAGSPVLYVRVNVHNPEPKETPFYWWSNIAVPESADVRVVAPADHAFHFDYSARLERLSFPILEGVDRSYTDRAQGAADFFFDIPDGRRRWVAALDATGTGLVQTSTDLQRGRKLFHWGTGQGGQSWQEWLSGPGCRYLEIQAGVARTQLEHVPMPGRTTWQWVEAYGLLQADPDLVHGDWESAQQAVGQALDRLVPQERLSEELESASEPGEPGELLAQGSGWGALEASDLAGLPWGTIDSEQQPWQRLLETGTLPVSDPPVAPVTGSRWRALLEAHPADWHARYHLGLVRHADGDTEGAVAAWTESLKARRTPWALRCIAHAEPERAADLLTEAHRMLPNLRALAVEATEALLAAHRVTEASKLIEALDDEVRSHGRIRVLDARAALAAGDHDRVRALLDEGIQVDNLREGEVSLDDLWETVRPDVPVPPHYAFRM